MLLAGNKHSTVLQPLTDWRANGRYFQQAKNTAKHQSHSLPEEPGAGIIGKLETWQSTTATHILKSHG